LKDVELPSKLLSTFFDRALIFLLIFRGFLKLASGFLYLFFIFNMLHKD